MGLLVEEQSTWLHGYHSLIYKERMAIILLIFFCTHVVVNQCRAESCTNISETVDLRNVFDKYLTRVKISLSRKPIGLVLSSGFWNINLPGSDFILNFKVERGSIRDYKELERVGDIGVYEDGYRIVFFVRVEPQYLLMHFENYMIVGSKFYANGEMYIKFVNFTFCIQLEVVTWPECAAFVIGAYSDVDLATVLEFHNINLHPALQREEAKIKNCLIHQFRQHFILRLNYIYGDALANALNDVDLCLQLRLKNGTLPFDEDDDDNAIRVVSA